ncbi:helix-turn-helix domain-containing protein [Streptomyces sp. NPDC059008]|uniref:helix-turn-helix domain-containing protein n=1 Tax=Streptomyces sp. NPDC059008 TaxID=3346693 RepID=UPI003694489F
MPPESGRESEARGQLGLALRALRLAKDMSMREVSTRANVSMTMIHGIEHGEKVPSRGVLEGIFAALEPDPMVATRITALWTEARKRTHPSEAPLLDELARLRERADAAEARAATLEELWMEQRERRNASQNVEDVAQSPQMDAAVASNLLNLGDRGEFAPAASQVLEGLDRLFQFLGPPPQGLFGDIEPQLHGGGGSQR